MKTFQWICADCGGKYGRMPEGHVSAWHPDVCDVCGENKPCTEPRDFCLRSNAVLEDAWKRSQSDIDRICPMPPAEKPWMDKIKRADAIDCIRECHAAMAALIMGGPVEKAYCNIKAAIERCQKCLP
jgi:hypothetical protein